MSESKFDHLTEVQLDTLYAQYMAGEKVATLLERWAIDLSPSMFIRAFPAKACDNLACPYCQVPMFQRRRSRQAYQWRNEPAFCKSCQHLLHFAERYRDTPLCHCPPCLAIREQARRQHEADQRERVLVACAQASRPPVRLATLGIRLKLYLVALLDTCLDWREGTLRRVTALKGDACLTPSAELDTLVILELHEAHVLLVDPMSPLSAFEGGPAPVPHLDKVRWQLNIDLGDGEQALATQVYRALHDELSCGPLPAWREALAEAIEALAVEEVYSFLQARCDEHDMPLHPWKRSREVIGDLVKVRPVCQLWALVTTAVNNAVTYASRAGISKTQASNTLPKNLLRYEQRATEEQWRFKHWNRNSSRRPRSGLCKALHGLLLKHDDHGTERQLADYLQALPGCVEYGCPACGSLLVHVQARPEELVINCKDCIARSVLPGAG